MEEELEQLGGARSQHGDIGGGQKKNLPTWWYHRSLTPMGPLPKMVEGHRLPHQAITLTQSGNEGVEGGGIREEDFLLNHYPVV